MNKESSNNSDAGRGVSPHVEKMVDDMIALSSKLSETANNKDAVEHIRLTIAACRLSRRIRLRLGNLWKLSDVSRQGVTLAFKGCAESIDPEMDFGDESECQDVSNAQNNIRTRAAHIGDPALVEASLYRSAS